MTVTRSKTKYPGITKITYESGEAKYRLIVSVGKRPRDQQQVDPGVLHLSNPD